MSAIQTTTKLIVDGAEKASVAKTLSISASVSLNNVQQVGSHIQGDVDLQIDTGIGTLDADFPFDIDTGLGNPIDVDLGSVSIPPIGDVEVVAEFSYDLPQRQLCAQLTLAGLVTVAKTCVNWQ
jgi:hypothetical protein